VSNATNYAANLEKVAGAQADVDANYQALQRLAHMNDDSGLNWNKNPRPAMPALDNPKEWAHLKDILRPDQQQVVIDQMQKRIQLGDGYTSRGKSAKDIADWNKANLYSSEAAANSAMQSKLKESGRGTFLAEGE